MALFIHIYLAKLKYTPLKKNLLMQTCVSIRITLILLMLPVIVFFYLPLYALSGYTVLLDLTSRLSPNDAYVGTYYFWWTNLLYLPLFFFGLAISFFNKTVTQLRSTLITILIVALFFYPVEL